MTNCALTTHSELEGWVLSFSISDSYKKTEQLTYCELDFVTPNIQKKNKNKTARQNSESFMV